MYFIFFFIDNIICNIQYAGRTLLEGSYKYSEIIYPILKKKRVLKIDRNRLVCGRVEIRLIYNEFGIIRGLACTDKMMYKYFTLGR